MIHTVSNAPLHEISEIEERLGKAKDENLRSLRRDDLEAESLSLLKAERLYLLKAELESLRRRICLMEKRQWKRLEVAIE